MGRSKALAPGAGVRARRVMAAKKRAKKKAGAKPKAEKKTPKRMGRPPKKPSERKDLKILVRVTKAQKELLVKRAEKAGFDLSDFGLVILANAKPRGSGFEERARDARVAGIARVVAHFAERVALAIARRADARQAVRAVRVFARVRGLRQAHGHATRVAVVVDDRARFGRLARCGSEKRA